MDVLINKDYKSYDYLSRYSAFPFYYNKLDDKYIYSTLSQLKDTTIYTVYEVQEGDTFDSIALEFYGNPTDYWVICDFNRIQDPFEELKVGTQLKVPRIAGIIYK